MIKLHNGYEFKYCCASGALGFDARGYWWEKPFIKPTILTVITKTLTYLPRQGEYKWWKFWETFRINRHYTLNALGLPNPGYLFWIKNIYPKIQHKNLIVSICPFTVSEAKIMALDLNRVDIKGIEINISCSNIVESLEPTAIIETVLNVTKYPVIVKIGCNYSEICKMFGNRIIIDAINTLPWSLIRKTKSPIHPLDGGLSDENTAKIARFILADIKKSYPHIQVISGNGIFDYNEAKLRFELGADAISFGTIFILTPWRPEQIIKRLNK